MAEAQVARGGQELEIGCPYSLDSTLTLPCTDMRMQYTSDTDLQSVTMLSYPTGGSSECVISRSMVGVAP